MMDESRPFSVTVFRYIFISLCLLFAIGGGLYYYLVVVNDPIAEHIEENNIYLVEGRLVKNKEEHDINFIFFSEIPEDTVNAFVAMEDARFFHHSGVDYIGVLRALWVNIVSQELQQGGSTITQQLAKNLFLEHDRTVDRKLTEIRIALALENIYSKQEILEMYLSQIYFGHGNRGIRQAAQAYFNKEATELTLGEGALLAGIIQAPNAFAPVNGWDTAVNRQKLVLERMEELKKITAEEAEAARSEAKRWR